MSFIKIVLLLLLAAALLACSNQPRQPTPSQRPAWITNPQLVGEVVGLGQARRHINGRAAQRELATRRALDEIARQLGVTVSNAMLLNQQLQDTGLRTEMISTSLHKIDGRAVNAVIHAEWQEGDTLYIIMVAH